MSAGIVEKKKGIGGVETDKGGGEVGFDETAVSLCLTEL